MQAFVSCISLTPSSHLPLHPLPSFPKIELCRALNLNSQIRGFEDLNHFQGTNSLHIQHHKTHTSPTSTAPTRESQMAYSCSRCAVSVCAVAGAGAGRLVRWCDWLGGGWVSHAGAGRVTLFGGRAMYAESQSVVLEDFDMLMYSIFMWIVGLLGCWVVGLATM